MGNCLNPASKHLGGAETMMTKEEAESLCEMKRISHVLQEEAEEEEEQAQQAQQQEEEEGLKVKIVLTRAELEWLMAQLKTGERRLEDVLHHVQAAKARADRDGGGWRPRLESIVECPETTAY